MQDDQKEIANMQICLTHLKDIQNFEDSSDASSNNNNELRNYGQRRNH